MSEGLPQEESEYILSSEGTAEMVRLTKQDRLITTGMGGLFSERDDIASMHDILDIACGPGGWATLAVALEINSSHEAYILSKTANQRPL